MLDDLSVTYKIIDDMPIALWCIEFDQPVAINCSDSEVIHQVFNNKSHWQLCNKAMAELYGIPEGLNPEKLPVSLNFDHSAANEGFIQEVIDNNYSADDLISVDQRHDGKYIYVINSVRCEIHDNLLTRFWGTARDITSDRQRLVNIQKQQSEMRSVLGALPDIVLICDEKLILKGSNPAFERELGWRAYDWIGKKIKEIIDINECLPLHKNISIGKTWSSVVARHKDGTFRSFELALFHILNDEEESRFVLVLRS